MSEAVMPEIELRDSTALTFREARIVKELIAGKCDRQAILAAGFSTHLADHPSWLISPQMRDLVRVAQQELTRHAFDQGLMDAEEVHQQLTDELRGDTADLYDDKGELLPIKDWPMWARQGGVEIIDEPNMVHSADEGDASWDQVGRRIKIRVVNRAKSRELLMKHKGVNAMVDTGDKLGQGLSDMAGAIEKALYAAREKARLRE
jgi:phage terminase small subunit